MECKKNNLGLGEIDVIPRYWDDVNIKTEEDILFLGEITIGEMIVSWKRSAGWLIHALKNNKNRKTELTDDLSIPTERRKLEKKKTQVDKKIKLLLELKDRAEKKPALPAHRPYHWFTAGSSVICRLVADGFVEARIIGPVYGDCISVCFVQNEKTSRFETREIFYTRIMHLWEFKYLREHPNFAKLWFGREVAF